MGQMMDPDQAALRIPVAVLDGDPVQRSLVQLAVLIQDARAVLRMKMLRQNCNARLP